VFECMGMPHHWSRFSLSAATTHLELTCHSAPQDDWLLFRSCRVASLASWTLLRATSMARSTPGRQRRCRLSLWRPRTRACPPTACRRTHSAVAPTAESSVSANGWDVAAIQIPAACYHETAASSSFFVTDLRVQTQFCLLMSRMPFAGRLARAAAAPPSWTTRATWPGPLAAAAATAPAMRGPSPSPPPLQSRVPPRRPRRRPSRRRCRRRRPLRTRPRWPSGRRRCGLICVLMYCVCLQCQVAGQGLGVLLKTMLHHRDQPQYPRWPQTQAHHVSCVCPVLLPTLLPRDTGWPIQ